jgi:hypothetical protein
MKKFVLASSLAIASSAGILMSSPANAACVTAGPLTTQSCTEFNAQSTSTTVDTFAYNDGGVIGADTITSIDFFSSILQPPSWTFSPTPINITSIEYSLNGGGSYTSSGLAFTSLSLGSASFSSNAITSNIAVAPITADSFRLRYTIPGGLTSSNAGFLTARVGFNKPVTGPQSQTRSIQATAFDTPQTPGVPSPLPLLGAGAAFGFSRKLRRRIAQFA